MSVSRILVVDGNATVRRVVGRTLTGAGYEVIAAEDGQSALDLAQAKAPALVLSDTALADMSAGEFRSALENVANLRHLPVVWMSALPELLDDDAIVRTRALDGIAKPFSPEALLSVTSHAITRIASATHVSGVTNTADSSAAVKDELRIERARKGEEVSFEGRIDHVSLGDVLQMLQQQRQTGVIEVKRHDRSLAVCMRDGDIDLALADDSSNDSHLGRYLLEEQLVDEELLEGMLEHPSSTVLGARLVKMGALDPEDLKRILVRQTSERLYEALRWKTGHYRFLRSATRPQANTARLGLPISAILMEGLRRVDEWRLIEEQIRSWDEVYRVDREALLAVDVTRFSRDERTVLATVDGFRSVRAIVAQSRLGSFEASKILFQLLTSRLIRRVR